MVTQRWMIGWTRPNAEFLVVEKLREIDFAACVPTIREFRIVRWQRNRGQGRDNRRAVLTPAFPRYVMFASTDAQPIWQRANRVDGMTLVVRRAGDRDAPGLLPDPVAARLLGPQGDGVLEDLTEAVTALERYARGAEISVTSGPFTGFPGVVVGHEGRNVRVLLSIFGRATESEMTPESIRAA